MLDAIDTSIFSRRRHSHYNMQDMVKTQSATISCFLVIQKRVETGEDSTGELSPSSVSDENPWDDTFAG